MQVDPPEMSSAGALAIAEALDDLLPRVRPLNASFIFFSSHFFFHSVGLPVPLLEASEPLAKVHLPCIPHLLLYVQLLLFFFSFSFSTASG
jgi:hypothetical protein